MIESKCSNKSGIMLLIVFVVLCATALIGFLIINVNDKKETKPVENNPVEEPKTEVSYHEFDVCTYDEFYESDGYIFFEDTVVYECQSSGEFGCYITLIDDFGYCNKTDSIALLTDNQKDFLYDYEKQEVVFETDSFEKVIYDELGSVAYFVFNKGGKEGIVSLTGKVLVDATYDSVSISYPGFTGEYSLNSGVVVASLSNKLGVIEIETGTVVVPFEYDNIKVYDEYYILEKDNKVSLVNLELDVIFDDDCDDIYVFNDTAFVEKDKTISFYNLKGEKIIEDTIKINRSYTNFEDTGYSAFSMDQYNQVITLAVYGDNMMDYEACYNLHLVDKKLETLDCKEVFDDYDDYNE